MIADNCTDRTAALAREAGAGSSSGLTTRRRARDTRSSTCSNRSADRASSTRSTRWSSSTPTPRSTPTCSARSTEALRRGHDWIQAYYTVANPDQSWRTRLMTYAFSLFNGVMHLGQNALGSSAGFKGNGMCFSTRGLRGRPWKSYGLVEDMEYSWTLRVAGEKILFLPEASVYGAMLGSGGQAAANQRRRWEFGRGEIRKKYLGPLLRSTELGLARESSVGLRIDHPLDGGGWRSFISPSVGLDAFACIALAGSRVTFVRGFLLACVVVMTLRCSPTRFRRSW